MKEYDNDTALESATLVGGHIQGILGRLMRVENGTAVPPSVAASSSPTCLTSGSLLITTMLVGNYVIDVMTLGDLVLRCKTLEDQTMACVLG